MLAPCEFVFIRTAASDSARRVGASTSQIAQSPSQKTGSFCCEKYRGGVMRRVLHGRGVTEWWRRSIHPATSRASSSGSLTCQTDHCPRALDILVVDSTKIRRG